MAEPFPKTIHSALLGTLTLEEFHSSVNVNRHYGPAGPITVAQRSGVRLVIWPPKHGLTDVAKFVSYIERTLEGLNSSFERILVEAEPHVAERIESWWWPDAPPGDAHAVLQSGKLFLVCINADGLHEVMLSDTTDIVSKRDVRIYLGAKLQPVRAGLDG
ncbi:MAG: hypothetical protein J0L78_00100 [Planctomycetes bacterium]|nr:hypothetical protein [Planctomycetota bacterium]